MHQLNIINFNNNNTHTKYSFRLRRFFLPEENADQDEDQVPEAQTEEEVEGVEVPAAHALAYPRAVMIMVVDAYIAIETVYGSSRSYYSARGTELGVCFHLL